MLIDPSLDLQGATDYCHSAFCEILGHRLASPSPSHTVDEVDLLLATAVIVVLVHHNGKAGNSIAAASSAKFRISRQAVHDRNMIQYDNYPL